MAYQFTLDQLDELSKLICEMDGPGNADHANRAHDIIIEALGEESILLYSSIEDQMETA